jgi:hypothetical protein
MAKGQMPVGKPEPLVRVQPNYFGEIMTQLFYIGLEHTSKGYIIYVSDNKLNGLNEICLRKHNWRSAVKHYEKYNLYDFFYKSSVARSLDYGMGYSHEVHTEGIGNLEEHIKEKKNEIKEDAKIHMQFAMEKDDKDDFKVIRK